MEELDFSLDEDACELELSFFFSLDEDACELELSFFFSLDEDFAELELSDFFSLEEDFLVSELFTSFPEEDEIFFSSETLLEEDSSLPEALSGVSPIGIHFFEKQTYSRSSSVTNTTSPLRSSVHLPSS